MNYIALQHDMILTDIHSSYIQKRLCMRLFQAFIGHGLHASFMHLIVYMRLVELAGC